MMGHVDVSQFVGLLVVMLGTAKLLGALAQRIGQPAVLGELVAGVILGRSVLGLVDPQTDILHLSWLRVFTSANAAHLGIA
jgi:Kef-type K+ transport system membrane component KefB